MIQNFANLSLRLCDSEVVAAYELSIKEAHDEMLELSGPIGVITACTLAKTSCYPTNWSPLACLFFKFTFAIGQLFR